MYFKTFFIIIILVKISIIGFSQESTYENLTNINDQNINHSMKAIPAEDKFYVARNLYQNPNCPNPKGWYHSVAGIAETDDGLVAVYRLSDAHTCNLSHIMVTYSHDGGRTWTGHHSISEKNVYQDHGIWVAPQLSKLSDGRLVIISDFGDRSPSNDWPMLSKWQQPSRGMSNHLFWSYDNGKTWKGPQKIDDVGGEPSYIVELSDGTLMYTRTESQETDQIWNAPLPWGNTYYSSVAVFSDDGGKTWDRASNLADSPLHGDCEVGVVELAPDTLLALTRIGFGGGRFGQPSRMIYSFDNGRSWKKHKMAPFYGQRNIVRKLHSGDLFVTYRHRWGTWASYGVLLDPDKSYGFQPSSFIWNEENCTINEDVMKINSQKGPKGQVQFSLYPAQAPSSEVTIETELKVAASDKNGCIINAGIGIRFEPDKISIVQKPETYLNIDATKWHKYKIIREKGKIYIYVDGNLELTERIAGQEIRYVSFGNGGAQQNQSLTYWKNLSANVDNKNDYSIDWNWDAKNGYPDQFRREHEILLDKSADSGYSGWTQLKNGNIVIVDYTNEQIYNATWQHDSQPFIRSYLTNEEFLRK